MDLSRLSQLTQLRYSYFAVPVIYILCVLWLPVATLWLVLLGWVGFNWYRVTCPVFKQGYWVILQSFGLHIALNLAAFASAWGANIFNRGGLFSGGGDDFLYLLILGLVAIALMITAMILPSIKLVKGYQVLMNSCKDCTKGGNVDSSAKSSADIEGNNSEAI
ncbi:hypothetical protein L2719_09505 [Shewanella schlegeliana]|uniref:Uncharacterized protein n=1 Tax=Shewanella schlegeliana TaxID=190308 RepID=A0ABS1SZK4_9GAMM|nr:hypothetical protein [Shewanella schlegeliana]MBL4912711.1 hypothetical protein [Shewanella schlegeliana]MCL1109779.1 hypothetical protein [Shewanella schlegeliana]GIU30334.1 hypothetical protein TUM4433_20690 [Shewanella schlegeliana]